MSIAGTTLSYSIVGGTDRNHFAINSSTGALTFIGNRDAELPGDANRDGVYIVQVQASDGALATIQTLSVTWRASMKLRQTCGQGQELLLRLPIQALRRTD